MLFHLGLEKMIRTSLENGGVHAGMKHKILGCADDIDWKQPRRHEEIKTLKNLTNIGKDNRKSTNWSEERQEMQSKIMKLRWEERKSRLQRGLTNDIQVQYTGSRSAMYAVQTENGRPNWRSSSPTQNYRSVVPNHQKGKSVQ
ncbi:unnamed protein product [Nezara viridula]|uniref:Uncharacterized protein n=1 Tax=Nezara viridula TaxID=85310 RepID=A0A9P0HH67_NEZVI|nr:unnamed protein product [Nezara viridula]